MGENEEVGTAQEDISSAESSTVYGEEKDVEEVVSAEETAEQTIPYARFKEVNDRKKSAEERAGRLEEENLYLRSLQQPQQAQQPPQEQAQETEFDYEHPNQFVENLVSKTLESRLPQILNAEIQRNKSREDAVNLFPELGNPDSQFFKETARYLYTSGLSNHPDGVKIAASVVATTRMPEMLGKIRTQEEGERKAQLRFVEGGKPNIAGEEHSFSQGDNDFLSKLGVSPEGKKRIAEKIAKKQGGR